MLVKKLVRLSTLIILGSSLYSCGHIPASVERPCPKPCGSFGVLPDGTWLGGRCKNLCTNEAWDVTGEELFRFIHPQLDNPNTPQNEEKPGATIYSSADNTSMITFGDEVCVELKCTRAERATLQHVRKRTKGLEREGLRALKTRKRPPLLEN